MRERDVSGSADEAEARGDLERLAYELALRALAQHEQSLTELRARTGIILAASAIAASFLGARALDGGEYSVLSILALVAFLATTLFSIYILAPKKDLDFALQGSEVYEYFISRGSDLAEAHRTLAYWIKTAHAANQARIERLHTSFRSSCIALVFEVVFWVAELMDTLT